MASWMGATDFNLVGTDTPEKVRAAYVSSRLFPVLQVQPWLGRTFLPEEDQHEGNRAAVVSYDLWQRFFAADPNVLGRTLTVDSYGRREYTVVGVMSPGFHFPDQCELWLPAGWMGVRLEERRSAHWYQVIARLKAGVTLDQAQREMNTLQARIEQQRPNDIIGSTSPLCLYLNRRWAAPCDWRC
jgi:putative ABC transport system permease protein